MELDYDFLKTFRRVEVNIPLLDAIKQIPKYAKFLKDLCTHKRKLKGNKQVKWAKMFMHLYKAKVLLSFHHPPCHKSAKILTLFTVPCTIGDCTFTNVMLDLEPQLMSCLHQFTNHYILVI